MPSTSVHLIIDTDCGIDDALALMAALSAREVDVVAITCVSGNTTLKNVVSNVSKVLRVCKREEVPFYAGCDAPLSRENIFGSEFHGKDGLGHCPKEFPEGAQAQKGMHASRALVEMAKNRKGELTLVMIGPCTNLAVAYHIDPNVMAYFKKIVVMGGNVQGRGNVIPGAEFNFASDPEAAHILVEHSQCPVVLVPWETVTTNWISWEFYTELIGGSTAKSRFLQAICKYTEQYYQCKYTVGHHGYELGDFLAVLVAIRPDCVTRSLKRRIAVELKGEHTLGQVVQAWTKSMLPKVTKHTEIVLEFDMTIVRENLTAMVQ
ncbi:uncharacterized protein C1683.06c-like [Varroa destructor]|uniref:Inosine/uridine-preferring nucleoside hydrolase domain-containing protein n=1 Tax=Varroa destructor TaxID=109461 RepID=A0A7M7KMP2_VARDE|nr:uncharacterized protein C1683.06c-like [Varroa destructor]